MFARTFNRFFHSYKMLETVHSRALDDAQPKGRAYAVEMPQVDTTAVLCDHLLIAISDDEALFHRSQACRKALLSADAPHTADDMLKMVNDAMLADLEEHMARYSKEVIQDVVKDVGFGTAISLPDIITHCTTETTQLRIENNAKRAIIEANERRMLKVGQSKRKASELRDMLDFIKAKKPK